MAVKVTRVALVSLTKPLTDLLSGKSIDRTFVSKRLNEAFRSLLSNALTRAGCPELAALVAKMGAIDVVASKDLSLRTLVTSQVEPMLATDAALKIKIEGQLPELSQTTTLGALLMLGTPLEKHPFFRAEVNQTEVATILNTSPVVAAGKLEDKFIGAYMAWKGSTPEFWKALGEDPAFQGPGMIEELQVTLQLNALVLGNVQVLKALQRLRQQGTFKSLRDLGRLDAAAWMQLLNAPIDGHAIDLSNDIPGATRLEKVRNYVDAILYLLGAAFPTDVIARHLATAPSIDLNLVRTIVGKNPGLSPANPLPTNVDLQGLSPQEVANARASLELLRREIRMFPRFDYRSLLGPTAGAISPTVDALAPPSSFQNPVRNEIMRFLGNSPDFDLRATRVDDFVAAHSPGVFLGIPESDQPAVVDQVKRMQRIANVTANPTEMDALMGEGLHSAYAIATIPRSGFLQRFSEKLGGRSRAMTIYAQAQRVHGASALVFTQIYQAVNDVTPRVIGSISENVKETLSHGR